MFQHMDVETELLKRTQAEGEEQAAGSDGKPLKYPHPAMKGSAGSGKGGTAPHQSEAPPTETEDPLVATAAALAPRTATGNQDWKANADSKDKEAEKGQQPRGNRQQGWQNSSAPKGRRGWGSQNWGGQGQRRSDKAYDQALEENVKLLARLCLRHEDELSQMRVERDFVITMESQEAAVLSKLYRLSTVWKEKKEKGVLTPPGSLPGAVPSVAGANAGSGSRHCGGAGPEGADHRARAGVHPGGPVRAPLVVHEVGSDNLNTDEARGRGAPQAEPSEQPHGTPAGDLSPYGVAEVPLDETHVIYLRGGDRDLSSLGGATGPQSCTGLDFSTISVGTPAAR